MSPRLSSRAAMVPRHPPQLQNIEPWPFWFHVPFLLLTRNFLHLFKRSHNIPSRQLVQHILLFFCLAGQRWSRTTVAYHSQRPSGHRCLVHFKKHHFERSLWCNSTICPQFVQRDMALHSWLPRFNSYIVPTKHDTVWDSWIGENLGCLNDQIMFSPIGLGTAIGTSWDGIINTTCKFKATS